MDPVDPHWAGDVLDLMVPEILETVRHAIPHLFEYRAGDDHTPGVCERLQPCCDVHAIAVDIVLIDDHIAEVDPDPNFDPLVLGERALPFAHRLLDLAGAAHRLDRAREFDQQAVTGGLDDAPTMLGDLGINQFAPMRLQPG